MYCPRRSAVPAHALDVTLFLVIACLVELTYICVKHREASSIPVLLALVALLILRSIFSALAEAERDTEANVNLAACRDRIYELERENLRLSGVARPAGRADLDGPEDVAGPVRYPLPEKKPFRN